MAGGDGGLAESAHPTSEIYPIGMSAASASFGLRASAVPAPKPFLVHNPVGRRRARSPGNRMKRSPFLCLFVLLAAAIPAHAQHRSDGGLLDPLSRLLRGSESGAEAPREPQRRVPFSREEMQLSFAPLVK